MTAPGPIPLDRIWISIQEHHSDYANGFWDTLLDDDAPDYTRRTPEALASDPIVLAMVAAALEGALVIARENCPQPAGGPFSHTNSMIVTAKDIIAGIEAMISQPASAALDAMLAQARKEGEEQESERFANLLGAAHGLSYGEDWNKGTAAKSYRAKLLQAVGVLMGAMASPQASAAALLARAGEEG